MYKTLIVYSHIYVKIYINNVNCEMTASFITHLLNLRFLCGLLRHLMVAEMLEIVFSTTYTTKHFARHINTGCISHSRLYYI
jgi:hypothetical protein